MFDPRHIDDRTAVAPQIAPADLAAIKQAGFVAVINNRPDAETADQPPGDAIRAAAAAQGLRYHAIPVGAAGVAAPMLEAMGAALDEADGPVLAFCRSGTRSCQLWALARAAGGGDPAQLIAQAAVAGYDLSGLAPTLAALADDGGGAAGEGR